MLRRCVHFSVPFFGQSAAPRAVNEPFKAFLPGSEESKNLAAALRTADAESGAANVIPCVVNGVRFTPGKSLQREVPCNNKQTLHSYHHADASLAENAVTASKQSAKAWSQLPFEDRAGVLLRAAQLLTKKYRYEMMAATMLNQSKNVFQAEIDCIGEAADFLRFNVEYAERMYKEQPISPSQSYWNRVEYRPLEGFVLSLSPFNFTAIAANLATAPILMGNTVVWKPSDNSLLSSYLFFRILEEADMPPGVVNFLPCAADVASSCLTKHRDLSAVAFTGSTRTFNAIFRDVGTNIDSYKTYPRLTGETGGKNFHLVHPSADMTTVAAQTVRSAFEYQGQKCSACSRLYVPASAWHRLKSALADASQQLPMGRVTDFKTMVGAVIDEAAFNKTRRYLDMAKTDGNHTFVAGGDAQGSHGWFVPPTIVQVKAADSPLMREEIFAPVLGVYVYPDDRPGYWDNILELVDTATPYGLTGAVFCRDFAAQNQAMTALRHTAGNLYINDKSTGAIVGQQPFGGGRMSGTNDKPGSPQFLHRFVSTRTVKTALEAIPQISYPHQLPFTLSCDGV